MPPPYTEHCSLLVTAVLVLKLQPVLPTGCPGSLEEKNQPAEGTGSLIPILFDVGALPQPKATGRPRVAPSF